MRSRGIRLLTVCAMAIPLCQMVPQRLTAGDTSTVQILAGQEADNIGYAYLRTFDMTMSGKMMLAFILNENRSLGFATSTDFGETWAIDSSGLLTAGTATNAITAYEVYRVREYFYVEAVDGASSGSSVLALWDGTAFHYDTIAALANHIGRTGLFIPDTGGVIAAIVGEDNGDDTTWINISDGTFGGDWSELAGSRIEAHKFGEGPRAHFRWGAGDGGCLFFESAASGNNWGWFDTAYFDDNISGNNVIFEYRAGVHHMAIQTVDSLGSWIEQKDNVDGDDSIAVRPFMLNRAGGGEMIFLDTTWIDDGTGITDGANAWPCLTYVRGTFTVIAYWLNHSGANTQIMRAVSNDLGATWSAPAVWRAADASTIHNMWAPSAIEHVNDTLVECVAWFSVSGGPSDAYIFRDIIAEGEEPPTETGTRVIVISQ